MPKLVSIDTEFERRKTYRPILSIVQIKQEGKSPIIFDVFKKKNEELTELTDILSDNSLIKIIHSARQDIEAIFYRFRIPIKNVFDTQIACKYITKEANISYSKLVEVFCKKTIIKEKSLQKSNWLNRPLSERQIFYAKQDVLFLEEAYHVMMEFFKKNETQYQQFKAECITLEEEKNYLFNPRHIWQKIKHSYIHDIDYGLIKDLFITREKLAFKANVPREFAVKTENLLSFARTKNISVLKTHYKIDKSIFVKVLRKYYQSDT